MGAHEQEAVLHTHVAAHRGRYRAMRRSHEREGRIDVAGFEAGLRRQLQHGHTYDAPGYGDLTGAELSRIESKHTL